MSYSWGNAASSVAGPSLLSVSSHAPASSFGGSVASSANVSRIGTSVVSRDDMLSRLVLDQASVDCQDYGIMDIEQVSEAKRELKHTTRKIVSLRTKLKVETKIRDAAVALRRAHRQTAHHHANEATPSFPTSTSPDRSSLSPTPFRHRSVSISSDEAKAEQDVSIATAKVDRVVRELFQLVDRASELRRIILEHQAATLSKRVTSLEFERQISDEQVPVLTSASSFDSLAPSASISAVGIPPYHLGISGDTALRQRNIEPSTEAARRYKFPPQQHRTEDVEQQAEIVKTLRSELATLQSEVRQRLTESDELVCQLELERQSRARAEEDLRASVASSTSERTMHEQKLRDAVQEAERKSQARIRDLQHALETAQRDLVQSKVVTRAASDESALHAAIVEAERKANVAIHQHRTRAELAEQQLSESKAQILQHERSLEDHKSRLADAEQRARTLALKSEQAEKASSERSRSAVQAQSKMTQQAALEAQGHASKLEALLQDVNKTKAALQTAEALAADRQSSLEREQSSNKDLRSQLVELTDTRADLQHHLKDARQQTDIAKTQAKQAQSDYQELELAVVAERRIMAERDGLFHAFERRLESAELRLQEQDKRCARMLGKLDGREEMDDLLERIKAGASGVAKKTKTAGQDIAALLSSLETHISDLELELARASNSMSFDSDEPSALHTQSPPRDRVDNTTVPEQERGSGSDVTFEAVSKARAEELLRAEEKLAQARKEAEQQLAEARKEAEQQLAQLRTQFEQDLKEERAKTTDSSASTSKEDVDSLARLEAEVDRLSKRNDVLEEQLRTSTAGANLRAMAPLGRGTTNNARAVGNLIDKFGGGRRLGPDVRGEDQAPAIQACIKTVEGLRSMLPDLSTAAAGTADLQAIQAAFQASTAPATPLFLTKKSNRGSAIADAGGLQAELDSIAAKMRGVLEVSKAVIEIALRKEPSEEADSKLRDEHDTLVADMKVRLTSLTAKLLAQREKEKKLVQTLAEMEKELSETRQSHSKLGSVATPPSASGLAPGSMLGLAIPSDKQTPSMSRATSQSHLSAHSFGTSPTGTLAPPRSPAYGDLVPSPTRSQFAAGASASLRYISPYAAPGMDSRSPSRKASSSGHALTDCSDLQSIPSSSPSSTTLGLPSPATSLSGLGRLQFDPPPLPQSSASVKRTITLGMDVPQLVARVRELERLLSQTISMRQKADKVSELEAQLVEANQAFAKLVLRMEKERSSDTQQKVGLLNELNDAHSQLQDTKAHVQRIQQNSPIPPLSPLPPPKDLK